MNPTVPERFRSELEALCVKYHVELHVGEDMHGDANLYLLQAEEGKGALEIDVELVLREPPKPYVPPPPTPEELARTAELQGLAAASRETWEAGLSKAPTHPEDNPETPDTFDLDGGAGPEEMARRTARAVQVCKALDGGGIDLRVFHLSGELNAVSREATEHAEARSALVDERDRLFKENWALGSQVEEGQHELVRVTAELRKANAELAAARFAARGPKTQKVAIRDPKSDANTCDCFKDASRCGRKPAGDFMLEGWPDSVMLCADCERGEHDHKADRDAHAVRVLDAWAKKHFGHYNTWAGCNADQSDRWIVWINREATDEDTDLDEDEEYFAKSYEGPTPSEARIAAADALLKEDPSLGDLTNG